MSALQNYRRKKVWEVTFGSGLGQVWTMAVRSRRHGRTLEHPLQAHQEWKDNHRKVVSPDHDR